MIHHPLVVNEGRTIRNPYQFVPFLFSFGKGRQMSEKQLISTFVLFLFRLFSPRYIQLPPQDSAGHVPNRGFGLPGSAGQPSLHPGNKVIAPA
ncbi:hypothetical protein MES5069_230187 [Mesorhizobium escarrei]|uniref:Uncharacterized protein n=1 Tax=Mesorhizobium escarrei TaxID=666018 RepID=A0ABM9DT37_9HYPH|nr:hypothetical protein MES5069_230187 [Mesorhizobium escarrei]